MDFHKWKKYHASQTANQIYKRTQEIESAIDSVNKEVEARLPRMVDSKCGEKSCSESNETHVEACKRATGFKN